MSNQHLEQDNANTQYYSRDGNKVLCMALFENEILCHDLATNTIALDHCGCETKLTKDRMNQYATVNNLHFHVWQNKKQFIVDYQLNGQMISITFDPFREIDNEPNDSYGTVTFTCDFRFAM